MTDIFLERPIVIAVAGGVATVVAFLMAVATGHRLIAVGALCILLLTSGLIVMERMILTPREQMYHVLRTIAADLETNDVNRIIRHISSTVPHLIDHARRIVPQYVIHQATVKENLVVEFTPPSIPERAIAGFNAVFRVSEANGSIKNLLSPWYFIVEFVWEDGRWRAVRYERRDPREGVRRDHTAGNTVAEGVAGPL